MSAGSTGFVLLAGSANLGSLTSLGESSVGDVSAGKSGGSSPVELCLSE